MASLTWIGFKELFNEKFTSKYQELYDEMNLVQMRHTMSFKAYVCYFNVQINTVPKIDKFVKKCIFLSRLQKWVLNTLYKFPKLPKDVPKIIKILERIEANGSKKKLDGPSQQSGLNRNAFLDKEYKKFELKQTNTKDKLIVKPPTKVFFRLIW